MSKPTPTTRPPSCEWCAAGFHGACTNLATPRQQGGPPACGCAGTRCKPAPKEGAP